MRKLDLLVPRYREPFSVLKGLLDSVMVQQNVDFDEVGVIIVDDGEMGRLDEDILKQYPYPIEYYQEDHRGVSATRNACLDHSKAEYVMFCDIDDCFYNSCGMWILFREMEAGFDSLVSAFIEETRNPQTKEVVYVNHDFDSTFVHGKVHKRKYLLKEEIRWNPDLTIHEDSYFNCLCQKLSNNVKYCQTPFYLWRWRDNSVCRHDPKYILKTYNNMLDSNTALVNEFLRRNRKTDAEFYASSMIYDAYLTLNKDEWWNEENSEYKVAVERRFKKYYEDFKNLFDHCDPDVKKQIYVSMKNRFFGEGMFFENVTFGDWIKHIENEVTNH